MIRIFPIYYAGAKAPEYRSDCFEPVMAGDDPHWAELTAHEKILKEWLPNHPNERYLGFCHYRRFPDFWRKHPSKYLPHIGFGRFKRDFAARYAEARILPQIEGYDVIVPQPPRWDPGTESVYRQYVDGGYSKPHIDKLIEIVRRDYPEMVPDMETYLSGLQGHLWLQFIMRADWFEECLRWELDILHKLEKACDWSGPEYDSGYTRIRVPAFLAERFINVFIAFKLRTQGGRLLERQCLFLVPDRECEPGFVVRRYLGFGLERIMANLSYARDRLKSRLMHVLGGVQEPWYSMLNALANALILLRHPERMTHPGTLHPDKTFYVINTLSPEVGLAGWYDIVIGYLARAERKGWTAVIDPPDPIQEDDGNWHAFFRSPTDIPLAEALQGRNVVFASRLGMIHKRFNRKSIELRHRLCERIPLSDEARAYVDARIEKLFEDAPERMVAVRFRGTDYRAVGAYCPTGHARVPKVEWFCDRVAQDMGKWGIPVGEGERLLVVTEEQEALDAIRARFPKCRFVEKERFADFRHGQYLVHHRLPTLTPKENNLMYLLEIFAMARCDYLIGGVNGGVLMALNLNGNAYRGVDVYNVGVN